MAQDQDPIGRAEASGRPLVAESRSYSGPHPDDGVGYSLTASWARVTELFRERIADPIRDLIDGPGSAAAARNLAVTSAYQDEAAGIYFSKDGSGGALWRGLSDDARSQFEADWNNGLVPPNHPFVYQLAEAEDFAIGELRVERSATGGYEIQEFERRGGVLGWGPLDPAELERLGIEANHATANEARGALNRILDSAAPPTVLYDRDDPSTWPVEQHKAWEAAQIEAFGQRELGDYAWKAEGKAVPLPGHEQPQLGELEVQQAAPDRFVIRQYDAHDGEAGWVPVNTEGVESYGLDREFPSRAAAQSAVDEYERDQIQAASHYNREVDHPFAGEDGSERESAWEDAQIAAFAERREASRFLSAQGVDDLLAERDQLGPAGIRGQAADLRVDEIERKLQRHASAIVDLLDAKATFDELNARQATPGAEPKAFEVEIREASGELQRSLSELHDGRGGFRQRDLHEDLAIELSNERDKVAGEIYGREPRVVLSAFDHHIGIQVERGTAWEVAKSEAKALGLDESPSVGVDRRAFKPATWEMLGREIIGNAYAAQALSPGDALIAVRSSETVWAHMRPADRLAQAIGNEARPGSSAFSVELRTMNVGAELEGAARQWATMNQAGRAAAYRDYIALDPDVRAAASTKALPAHPFERQIKTEFAKELAVPPRAAAGGAVVSLEQVRQRQDLARNAPGLSSGR